MTPTSKNFLQQETKWLLFLIALAVLVNFSGLYIPLMDPDAAVYASVSKNMVLRNNYCDLFFQGTDWLDKPHFPFWITAICFKLFGIHTWSYKLPGILFVMLGAYYTYRFANKYYNGRIALWAVFILLTAEHIIISNNDVRAEPFLTGLIIAAIYHFSNLTDNKRTHWWQLVAACCFSAGAVMTKGIFTLVPIGGAVLGDLLVKKKWGQLFHWRWLVAAVLIALFITPELYCLWQQFDRHPEKIVFGRTNVSGIHFFLWDSQFGRFTNTGPIRGSGDPLFFFHTLLWAFLPWMVVMYVAIVRQIAQWKRARENFPEWFAVSGSLLTLAMFSLSRFQLPYYTNIIFPLLAILTAREVERIIQHNSSTFRIIQNAIAVFLIVGAILLHYYYSPVVRPVPMLILAVLIVILIIPPQWLSSNSPSIALYRAGLASLALNFYLNSQFYPDLLKYQSSTEAAFYLNKNFPGVPGVRFKVYAPAFEFYLKGPLIKADTADINSTQTPAASGIWYLSEPELQFLDVEGRRYSVVKEFNHFHVTTLTGEFLNKKTRDKALIKFFLVKLR